MSVGEPQQGSPCVPKLKIRRGGVVDDIFPSASGILCGICSGNYRPAGTGDNGEQLLLYSVGAENDIRDAFRSVLFHAGPVSLSKNFRRSGNRKVVVDSKEEMLMPRKGMEDAGDSRRTRRGREDPSSEVEDRVLQDRGVSRTSIHLPAGK
ncbi:Uncharacterized protein Fot_20205 [Forsythia ovata]|uniref:Uncharacterized protein n=1 Tax=Forsythia ovata TaxID=205694 RepID=A0ABD1VN75_9LAMI